MFKLFLLSLVICSSSFANDTLSAVVGGNLVFKSTKDILMESEILDISESKVRVEYVFKNLSDKDIESDISFPLQEMSSESPMKVSVGGWDTKDPLDFTVWADDKKIPVKVIETAKEYAAGSDVYSYNVTYVWKQIFKAMKSIKVVHTYKNVLGSGGGTDLGSDRETYCTDKEFEAAFEKVKSRIKKKANPADITKNKGGLSSYMHFRSFGHFFYVLKTANNWAGPIKDFKMIIRKESPKTIFSLCWDGKFKKVSSTQFVTTMKNFSPSKDLKILFVNE